MRFTPYKLINTMRYKSQSSEYNLLIRDILNGVKTKHEVVIFVLAVITTFIGGMIVLLALQSKFLPDMAYCFSSRDG